MKLIKSDYDFLILGSNGFLGGEIVKELKKTKFTFFCIARKNSDYNINLNNHKKLIQIFEKINFRYVINCAAIISLDSCEKKKHQSSKINFLLPKFLGKISQKFKFKIVQISTDHVYFSKKKNLNSEQDKTKPINFYAGTKIKAEKSLRFVKKHLIIRTNFTGKKSSKNPSFVDWIFLSTNKKKVKLFNDMFTSTIDVKSCANYIIKLTLKNSVGIFNLGSKNQVSKKEFALKFAKKLGLKLNYESVSTKIYAIKRGKYLGMNVNKIEKKLNTNMPTTNKVINNIVKDYK